MKRRDVYIRIVSFVLLGGFSGITASARAQVAPLSDIGEKIRQGYEERHAALRAAIVSSLPTVDDVKKTAFIDAKAVLMALEPPAEGASAGEVLQYRQARETAESNRLFSARSLLADLHDFLGSDALDRTLVPFVILDSATPAGLARYGQEGHVQQAQLDALFADEALMRQMLVAGGASDGQYGETLRIYHAILAASERARESGSIFQRLALGTALEMPKAVRGHEVERYLHYEQAFMNGELDPAFETMTTWECRMITNGSRTNEELAWMRDMLRIYRPDHIRNPDYKWRYARIIKSDMPYCSIRQDPSLGSRSQQALALGGSCGPRAWLGRLATRAFGIPSRRHPQPGHAAMSHWTPNGWMINFGAWWTHSPGGLSFYLDSRAREFPDAYMQALRAEWIGDALGEEDVRKQPYGVGGGFWNQFGFCIKAVIVDDAEIAKTEEEEALAALSADEAKTLLGESDAILIDRKIEQELVIPAEHRTIWIEPDGGIVIPAASCVKPTTNTTKIAFMESWDAGWQVHYQRMGNQPELLKYQFELPKAGTFEMVAKVATVSHEQTAVCRINRRTLVDVSIPYTKGYWQETQPVTFDLREGRNTIMFTCDTPNRGVSIKSFRLNPVR